MIEEFDSTTPIHTLVFAHDPVGPNILPSLQFLIERGADIEAHFRQDDDVYSALDIALESRFLYVARYLIVRYANVGKHELSLNPQLLDERKNRLAEILAETCLPRDLQRTLSGFVIAQTKRKGESLCMRKESYSNKR